MGSRSRSSLPPRGSTPSGSVAPSSPPCPPSSRCGSRSRSTTSADPPLSTASASKCTKTTTTTSISCCHNCKAVHVLLLLVACLSSELQSLMKQLTLSQGEK